MSLYEIVLIAIGLALDAFAVSIAAASSGNLTNSRAYFRMSFHFGLFQFMMPIIGWSIGINLVNLVKMLDHWIAFILLIFVGLKMIYESLKPEDKKIVIDPSKGSRLIILSVSTSIDALIVGFSLGMLNVSILFPSIMIGIITGILSLFGIYLGKKFAKKSNNKFEMLGGAIIALIGVKILIEHLFFG